MASIFKQDGQSPGERMSATSAPTSYAGIRNPHVWCKKSSATHHSETLGGQEQLNQAVQTEHPSPCPHALQWGPEPSNPAWANDLFGVSIAFAMVGDGADNIPGIRGVGPKAAATLLTAFGKLESIYQNLDKIPGIPIRGAKGLVRKLEEGRDDAKLAKALVTLRHDVPIDDTGGLDNVLKWKGPTPEAQVFFQQLGYMRPLNDLQVAYELRKSADSTH